MTASAKITTELHNTYSEAFFGAVGTSKVHFPAGQGRHKPMQDTTYVCSVCITRIFKKALEHLQEQLNCASFVTVQNRMVPFTHS